MPAHGAEPVARAVDTTVPGPAGPVPVRVHTPAERPLGVVVYLHGGGHVTGTIDSYDGLTRRLANRTPATVVSVGYRRAPEHRCPAAVEDAVEEGEAVVVDDCVSLLQAVRASAATVSTANGVAWCATKIFRLI